MRSISAVQDLAVFRRFLALLATRHGQLLHKSDLAAPLGIAELEKSPFLGALFEGFIAAELIKAQLNAEGERELYHFRDQQGFPELIPDRE